MYAPCGMDIFASAGSLCPKSLTALTVTVTTSQALVPLGCGNITSFVGFSFSMDISYDALLRMLLTVRWY